MKRSLLALFIFMGCALSARAAEPVRAPVKAASSSTSAAAKTSPSMKTAPSQKSAKTSAELQPWPQEASDLVADPRATWGRLDNGLRYVILPTDAPGRASLQLLIRAGSMYEADDQQGMAHFLEHLAFNGTKHFPPGQMIEYFQRLGMAFGAHTNATTFQDHTFYRLDMPRTSEDITGEGLKLFRDFLDGMLLDKKEIDRERRVIFSELLAGNSAAYRGALAYHEFALPKTLAPLRFPIGKPETLRAMGRDRFVDFYESWYTPGRATIVAVGKFEPKMVERLIKQNFGDAKARRGEQPDPDFGKVEPTRGITAKWHSDAEASAVTVQLAKVAPAGKITDSVARQRELMVRGLTSVIVNARLTKLTSLTDAPIQGAGFSHDRMLNVATVDAMTAVCKPGQWKQAIGVLDQELRRATAYGFSDDEFKLAQTIASSAVQAAAQQEDTFSPVSLASNMVESLVNNTVITTASAELELAKKVLPGITKAECEALVRNTWQSDDVQILVSGNVPSLADGVEQAVAAYRQSRANSVARPSEEKVAKFAYTDFGPAGKIVQREEVKDLGIIQATFANNVRVNVKRTALEKDIVQIKVRIGGGALELPAAKPGLPTMANSVLIDGGLKAHSLMDLNRALADKQWGLAFVVGHDAFEFSGGCAASALETELDVCTAFITAPGYRAEAMPQFKQNLDSLYGGAIHSPEGVAGNEVAKFLHGGDARFGLPEREALEKLTLDDLQAWLTPAFESGYMEVAVVGDVDPEQALQLAAKTFGALPTRAAAKPSFADRRKLSFPVGVKAKQFPVVADTQRAISMVSWPVIASHSFQSSRRLNVLTRVLFDRIRLKIRQELGATYSPRVFAEASDTYGDYGYLAVQLIVDPKQLPEIGPLVVKMGAELAAGKISDDEFDRAIKPVWGSLDDLSNSYWLGVLEDCQERPSEIENARNYKADTLSIKKSEIESLAKKYLSRDAATVIGVSPAADGPVALGK